MRPVVVFLSLVEGRCSSALFLGHVVYPCLSSSSDDHYLLHSCLGTGVLDRLLIFVCVLVGAVSTPSNRVLRTLYPAKVPRVILTIIALEHTCPNHRHAPLLLLSCEVYHLQS